jgi:Xaa-Pro aminopeptidase
VSGEPAGAALDLARMRRERGARLRAALERSELGALLLLGANNSRFAAGVHPMHADAARVAHERTAVLFTREGAPHVFTPFPESAPGELARDQLHPPLWLESEAGVGAAARALRAVLGAGLRGPLGVDEHSPATWFGLGKALGVELADAAAVLGAAKLVKSADELECIRRAQRANESAMQIVQTRLRPGLRQCDLSALFLEALFETEATGNCIDPIWQVMEPSRALGPWTTHGDLAFPTCTTDRILREGDVIWVDTGIDYCGYASDFGRTWIVGQPPRASARQRDQLRRWRDVIDAVLELVRPGTTGLELVRRATAVAGGRRPWPEHFYLIHGIGTDPAEMPLIGTDLGEAFDESVVLAPGMVLVLEPAIWDEGHGGYRAEEIVAVSASGYTQLTSYPYAPFAEDA